MLGHDPYDEWADFDGEDTQESARSCKCVLLAALLFVGIAVVGVLLIAYG